MRIKLAGNKRDSIIMNVKNKETFQLPAGLPVCLQVDPTSGSINGLNVVQPVNAGNYAVNQFMGVLETALDPDQVGEAVVFGLAQNAIFEVNSRTATTDGWVAQGSRAAGIKLDLDLSNNASNAQVGFKLGNTVSTATPSTPILAILASSVASQASSASNATDTRLTVTAVVPVFVTKL